MRSCGRMNSANWGTCVRTRTFSVCNSAVLSDRSHLPQSESTLMNIFYIIGVIVVIVVVAGFFGLHA